MTFRRSDVQKLLIKLHIANNIFHDIVTSTGPHDGHGGVVGGAGGQLAAKDGEASPSTTGTQYQY
jgi:hypothetical protein